MRSFQWWLLFLSGILMVMVGVYLLFTPSVAYFSLSLVFALGMVFSGLLEFLFGAFGISPRHGKGWLIVGGGIDLLIGIYLLYYPLLSIFILPAIMGLWMLFRGAMAIGGSIEGRARGGEWGMSLILGLLIVICSVIVLNNPLLGIINIVVWTAAVFILSGVFRIYQALIHRIPFREI